MWAPWPRYFKRTFHPLCFIAAAFLFIQQLDWTAEALSPVGALENFLFSQLRTTPSPLIKWIPEVERMTIRLHRECVEFYSKPPIRLHGKVFKHEDYLCIELHRGCP